MASRAVSYRGDSAPLAWLASSVLALALAAGCRDHGSSDQATRPLPAPEPPAPAAAALPRDDVASPPKKRTDDTDTAARPKRQVGDEEGAQAPGEATPAAGEVAAPSADNAAAPGAGTPAAPSSTPGAIAPSAACVSRCQAAMQGCLSTPVDGGVPGFGNIELCKKAFEACQSACSTQ